jgi:hypothetical protein
LKLGPARWVDPRPGWPRAGTGSGWKKIWKVMIWCNPAVWPGKIRLQPVDFCFSY